MPIERLDRDAIERALRLLDPDLEAAKQILAILKGGDYTETEARQILHLAGVLLEIADWEKLKDFGVDRP